MLDEEFEGLAPGQRGRVSGRRRPPGRLAGRRASWRREASTWSMRAWSCWAKTAWCVGRARRLAHGRRGSSASDGRGRRRGRLSSCRALEQFVGGDAGALGGGFLWKSATICRACCSAAAAVRVCVLGPGEFKASSAGDKVGEDGGDARQGNLGALGEVGAGRRRRLRRCGRSIRRRRGCR